MTLTQKDFSNQNCNGYDLSNRNLSGYNFTRTQLNGSNLRNTILDGATLKHSQLSGADLTNSSLRGADLRNAQLSGANFTGAELQETRFQGSTGLSEKNKKDLKARGAIFDDSLTIERQWLIEKVLIPLTTLLIGSSGLVGIWQLLQKPLNPNSPRPSIENIQRKDSGGR